MHIHIIVILIHILPSSFLEGGRERGVRVQTVGIEAQWTAKSVGLSSRYFQNTMHTYEFYIKTNFIIFHQQTIHEEL